jgi:hypothetical protein
MSNQKKPAKKYIGRLGSGILSDSIKTSEHGKVDCYGVFTIFYAFGYPCSRSWKATITAFELPKGNSLLTIALKKGNKIINVLGTATINSIELNGVISIPIPLTYRFSKPGAYMVECSLRDIRNKLRIPFEVRTKGWPVFTEKEIEFARNNASIPQSLRATVHCDKCEHAYIFEETFIPDMEIKGGVFRFPDSGKFDCKECDQILELRDLQGQLRFSLKEMISQKMQSL